MKEKKNVKYWSVCTKKDSMVYLIAIRNGAVELNINDIDEVFLENIDMENYTIIGFENVEQYKTVTDYLDDYNGGFKKFLTNEKLLQELQNSKLLNNKHLEDFRYNFIYEWMMDYTGEFQLYLLTPYIERVLKDTIDDLINNDLYSLYNNIVDVLVGILREFQTMHLHKL